MHTGIIQYYKGFFLDFERKIFQKLANKFTIYTLFAHLVVALILW